MMIHTATVKRPSLGFVPGTKKPVNNVPTLVTDNLICRIEPLSGREQESVLGRFPKATQKITWRTTELKSSDIITWSGQEFILQGIKNYFGHHFEAVLEEKK